MRALRRHRPPRRHVECGAPAPPRYGQGRAGPGLAATSTRRGRFLSGRARPPRAASGAPLKCGAAQGGAHHRRWRRPGAARWVPSARSAARPALSGAGLAACGRGVRRWAGQGRAGLGWPRARSQAPRAAASPCGRGCWESAARHLRTWDDSPPPAARRPRPALCLPLPGCGLRGAFLPPSRLAAARPACSRWRPALCTQSTGVSVIS